MANPAIVNSYNITAGSSFFHPPNQFRLQGSNNGTNWIDLEINNTGFDPAYESTLSFSFNNTTAYTHYRLYISSCSFVTVGYPLSASSCQVRELTLQPKGTFIVTNDGNVGVDTENPTEKLYVDGNILANGSITPDYVFEHYFDGENELNSDYEFLDIHKTITFAKNTNTYPMSALQKALKNKRELL